MQKTIIIILFSLFSLSSMAQLSVGARTGYSKLGLYLEPLGLDDNQTEYFLPNFGLVMSYNNSKNAGFQIELNYAKKGWHEEDTSLNNSFFERNINYLELPVLSHFEFGQGAVRPVLTIGPYISYKLSESVDSTNYSHITKNHAYNHFEQEIRTFHYGLKASLGLRYNINKRFAIYAEGRYDIDIAGSRDIFIDRPNDIQASRLKEMGISVGFIWHLVPQQEQNQQKGYTPKENL